MMHLRAEIAPAIEEGSCQFCNDQISEHGTNPRAKVIVVQDDRGPVLRACRNCAQAIVSLIHRSGWGAQ